MGYDITCMISGFPNASHCNEVLEEYVEELRQCIQREDEADHPPGWRFKPTRDVLDAFAMYTEADEENRKAMVLIGPFDEQGDVIEDIPNDLVCAMRLVRTLHGVVPAPREGSSCLRSTATQRIYNVATGAPGPIFVNASALRILARAAPRLTPARLWALHWRTVGGGWQGHVPGIEYGPVWAGGMYVSLRQMEDDARVDAWMLALMRAGAVHTAQRREMMMGMGRQWVFVRPDSFPVQDALAYRAQLPAISRPPALPDRPRSVQTLPLDVLLHIAALLPLPTLLAFATLSRALLCALRPEMDALVRAYVARHEPWHVPGAQGRAFPWAGYARACGESASMKNRRRIWGVVEQLAAMADDLGIP